MSDTNRLNVNLDIHDAQPQAQRGESAMWIKCELPDVGRDSQIVLFCTRDALARLRDEIDAVLAEDKVAKADAA
jgi:hypothetical protein